MFTKPSITINLLLLLEYDVKQKQKAFIKKLRSLLSNLGFISIKDIIVKSNSSIELTN